MKSRSKFRFGVSGQANPLKKKTKGNQNPFSQSNKSEDEKTETKSFKNDRRKGGRRREDREPKEDSGIRIGRTPKSDNDIRSAFKKKQSTSFSRSGADRSFKPGGKYSTGFNEKFEARRGELDKRDTPYGLKEDGREKDGQRGYRPDNDNNKTRPPREAYKVPEEFDEKEERYSRKDRKHRDDRDDRDSRKAREEREARAERESRNLRGKNRDRNDRDGSRPPKRHERGGRPSRNEERGFQRDNRGQDRTGGVNQTITGFVKRHPDGFGFLIPDKPGMPDVYVPKPSMVGVMSNDKIEILVRKDGDRFRGDFVGMVSRETKRVTGKLVKKSSTHGMIYDESFAWGDDLKVAIPPAIKVNDEDWVLVKITHYPDSVRGFQGDIEAVLGDISDAKNDNIRVLASSGIPFEFTKETLQEAAAIPDEVTEEDLEGRKDLRDKNFITIDGKTAKDFDDAIYVEKMKGGFRLWVAIADVSHYVKPKSAIDQDAYLRGTSTYFPNFVAPMLPESLSNEMCSLKPRVDRLVLVSEMDIDYDGVTTSSRFYEAVINSQARVTYGEAQEIVDGGRIEKFDQVANNIKIAAELSHILMKARFENGSLNLEVPETTIEIDESGLPVDILRSERLFAHRLIEELMLAANVATARFLDAKGVPGFYRIHDKPKLDAITILQNYLEVFGQSVRLEGPNLQKKLTAALQAFAGKPQETILNILTLRSMAQAKYSPENIGHFGLGFSHYSHFTSPIRRYPDLIVHRLIKSVFAAHKGYRRMGLEDLETAGTILSSNEQRSVKAERQIHSIKKARFIEKFVGQEFEGVISSVTKFGVFVLLRQFDVDGLVKLEELGGDRFEFDEERLVLVGRRSGKSYEIGDPLRVQVAAADIQTGRIDFVIPTDENDTHVTPSQNSSTEKRRPIENDRERVREARVSRPGGKGKAKQVRSDRKDSRGPKRRR